jgi:hypothetical protein
VVTTFNVVEPGLVLVSVTGFVVKVEVDAPGSPETVNEILEP